MAFSKVALWFGLLTGLAGCGTIDFGLNREPSSSLPLVELPPHRDQVDLVFDRVRCARRPEGMPACLSGAGYPQVTETAGAAFVAAVESGMMPRQLAVAVYRTDSGAVLLGESELFPRHKTSPIVLDGAGGRSCDGVARIVRAETADTEPLGDALLGCSDGTILSLRLTMDTPTSGHGVGWDSGGQRYHVLFSATGLGRDRARLSRALRMVGDAQSPVSGAQAAARSEQFSLRHVRHGKAAVPRVYKDTLAAPAGGRKVSFLRRMLPLVLASNEVIRAERAHMLPLLERRHVGDALSPVNQIWLERLAKRYDANVRDNPTLRYRVDAVPPSLALAQAALETGWGRSRFARDGNAMFGEWTFGNRRGLVPDGRAAGETHKIRSFDTLLHSVRSYMDNLNTNQAYRQLRAERAKLRALGRSATGLELAGRLENYAGDHQYIPKLRRVMQVNAFTAYDQADLSPPVLKSAAYPVPRPTGKIQLASGPSGGIGLTIQSFLRGLTGKGDSDAD